MYIYGYDFFQTAGADVEHLGFTVLQYFDDTVEKLPNNTKESVPKNVAEIYINTLFTAILDSYQGE